MRKLNKQDFIFAWSVLLFIVVMFMIYPFINQYFIIHNCNHSMIFSLSEPYWYRCFWYLYFFDKVSIYIYILFLWITIFPFIKRRYQFSNMLYIIWILALVAYVLYIYKITPIISIDDFIEWLPKYPSHR